MKLAMFAILFGAGSSFTFLTAPRNEAVENNNDKLSASRLVLYNLLAINNAALKAGVAWHVLAKQQASARRRRKIPTAKINACRASLGGGIISLRSILFEKFS